MALSTLVSTEDRQFALCCPPGIDGSDFTSIISQFLTVSGKNVRIVTHNPRQSSGNIPYDTYSSLEADGSPLFGEEPSIFVFENGVEAVKILSPEFLKRARTEHKMVFILHYGITSGDFTMMGKAFPTSMLLYGSFAEIPEGISFNEPHISPLSYEQVNIVETRNGLDDSRVRAIESMCYSEKYLSGDAQMRVQIEELMEDAKINTGKLRDLLMYLTLNREQRHVVYTAYDNFYGLEALKIQLQAVGIPVFAGSDDIQNFNKDPMKPAIMILSLVPTTPLHNVTQCNFYDIPSYDGFISFLRSIYNVKFFPSGTNPKVTFNFFISSGTENTYKPVDQRLYAQLYSKIVDAIQRWDMFKSKGNPVVLGKSGVLEVLE